MKRKKISKLVGLLSAACLSLGAFFCPAATIPAQAAADPSTIAVAPEIQPYSDIIDYVYLVVETHVYKRLYNFSTGNYIGNWIYVGETSHL